MAIEFEKINFVVLLIFVVAVLISVWLALSFNVINYVVFIFGFILVFIVVYSLLVKTKVLGGNQFIMLLLSFVLAGLFIVELAFIRFMRLNSIWFGIGVFVFFTLIIVFGFIAGKEPLDFLIRKKWGAWFLLGIILGLFVISSAYVFDWTINLGRIYWWFNTEWFGLIFLLIIVFIVAWKIKK
jgi:hypothetical protein